MACKVYDVSIILLNRISAASSLTTNALNNYRCVVFLTSIAWLFEVMRQD